ncbi:MAG: Uma2 family endonuclease [Bacteroidota bacterium]
MTAPLGQAIEKKKRKITWETFQQKYLTREVGYKYEWLNGTVEKTPHMNKEQLYILHNLQKFFRHLLLEKKVTGDLIAEADLFFKEHHRRPDICWLTEEQIYNLAEEGTDVPSFVIEVISKSDKIVKVEAKMEDYRLAGVQVVWRIFPHLQTVHVITGENLENSIAHSGDMICSAAPALLNFQMPVSAIFAKKKKN